MEKGNINLDQMSWPTLNLATVLRKENQGSCKDYDLLLHMLAQPTTETPVLKKYLHHLRDYVSLVTKDHERLVGIILNLNWLDRDVALTQEYKLLLLNLLSAHPYYLRACVRMLIKKFILSDLPELKIEASCSESFHEATWENNNAKFIHVHELLQAVAKIIPMTKTVAIQLMRDLFPYYTRDVDLHKMYTSNLLQSIQYLPDLRPQILEIIVDKMLQLDVRASRQDIIEKESSAGTVAAVEHDTVFDTEDVKMDEGESGTQVTQNHEEAMRLDIMMNLTMQYIYTTCFPNGKLAWEVTRQLYRELLSVFSKLILPTHSSCHVQFLLFYICSFRQELLVGFVDFLWNKVKIPMNQSVFRQSAACYIGSFLARASYIDLSTVKATLKMMADWLHGYLNQVGGDSLHTDLAHHAAFYAVSQALFYVICFHSQRLLAADKELKWAESLNLQRLVSCKLNPLKICLPLVGTKFASVTRMHQLAFCDSIIQRNNRLRFVQSEPMLEAHFPFDPYLLKRSSKWIKGLYREYDGIILDKNKEDDDEDADDFVADEEDKEMSLGSSAPNSCTHKLDFLKYSITPGFKL